MAILQTQNQFIRSREIDVKRCVLHSKPLLALVVLLTLSSLSLAQREQLFAADPKSKATATIQPLEIYEGESTVLTISIDNPGDDVDIDVQPLEKDFIVERLGATRRTSVKTVRNGNGLAQAIEDTSVDFKFRITPKVKTSAVIPELTVNDGDHSYISNSLVLKINEASATDVLVIETSVAPKTEIYPLQPLEMGVDVFIKENPGKYQRYDPLALTVENFNVPQLTIPWLEDENIDKNAIWEESTSEWLSSMENARYGFRLNEYQSQPFGLGSFSLFFDSGSTFFLPKPEKAVRKDSNGNDANYWKYSFKRKLRVSTATTFHLAPSTFKGTVVDFTNPDEPRPQQIYVKSNSVDLTIKAIPEENAPSDYIGVFGNVKMSGSLSNATLAVGDVATLAIKLSGYGSFDDVRPPHIENEPRIVNSFKTYPPTEEPLRDGVIYNYQIRPIKEGKLTIPSITASFFNVETGKFERLQTEPFELDVRKGVLRSEEEPDFVDKSRSGDEKGLISERSFLTPKRVILGSVTFLTIALAILLGCGVKIMLKKRAEAIAASNRHFVDVARQELKLALQEYSRSPTKGLTLIRLVFLRLVGRKFDQNVDSITDAEFADFLTQEFANSESNDNATARMREFLLYAERQRFAACADADPQFARNVENLLASWIELLSAKFKRLESIALRDNADS